MSDLKKIHDLNEAYIHLVQHLNWTGHFKTLKDTLGVDRTLAAALNDADDDRKNALTIGRATVSFEMEFDVDRVEAILKEQASKESNPLGQLLSSNSALIELGNNPAKLFINLVLREAQAWHAFSPCAGYRFGLNAQQLELVAKMSAESLVALALDESTQLAPRFSESHLISGDEAGLIPASLLYS